MLEHDGDEAHPDRGAGSGNSHGLDEIAQILGHLGVGGELGAGGDGVTQMLARDAEGDDRDGSCDHDRTYGTDHGLEAHGESPWDGVLKYTRTQVHAHRPAGRADRLKLRGADRPTRSAESRLKAP